MLKSSGSRRGRKTATDRPKKPFPHYPLYPPALGYWSAKVNGRIVHFGRWGRVKAGALTPDEDYVAGWTAALATYKARFPGLHDGTDPGYVSAPDSTTGLLTVKAVGDRFLTAKSHRLTAGEIGQRTWN